MASLYSSIVAFSFFTLFAFPNVAAQSLQKCAQSCVGSTRTKCQPTDYACACSDGKYMPKLIKCIDNFCEGGPAAEAHLYLTNLCRSAGAPLEIDQQARLEQRQDSFFDVSFTRGPSNTDFSAFPSSTGSPYDGTTGGGGGAGSGAGGRRKGGGASVKISIGVVIPLVILGVAVLVWSCLKRAKKRKEAAMAAAADGQEQGPHIQEKHQGMPGSVMAGTPAAPAELSQSAMFAGHEMPTQGNTVEMPAPVPGGYDKVQGPQSPPQVVSGQQQPWPQVPQVPQASHAPQGQQQWVQGQPVYDHAAQAPQQYPQGQWVFIPQGQPLQVPQPAQGSPQYTPPVEAPGQYAQPSPPSELPGR